MLSSRVIGVGSPLVDMLAHVSDEFVDTVHGEKGGMELIDAEGALKFHDQLAGELVMAPGGSAANTMYGLAMLGQRPSFLGKIGDCDHGGFYMRSFLREGICTSRFKQCQNASTGMCISLVTPDAERTCRTYLGAAMNLVPADVSVGDFAGHTHAHLEGYLIFNPVITRHVLNCARQAHVSVSLDLASFEVVRDNREFIGELLDDYVDIVFANSDESEAFCGSTDPEEGLEALRQHCKTAVVKVGADGAYLAHGSRRTFAPAVEAKALDTTGAGDLWASGFLWAHLTGHDLNTAGRIGALLGGAVVEVMGARIPDPTWQTLTKQIEDILNER